ncbi:polymer-forming cytoskeletal protein [Prevotella sp. 10(H)]|uniref:bactofilin family protein n=1 Tax=Prevotella sp. 10(H) TaxID=1158294 RepID=UPI00068C4F52|nr:polymer-forming cytoskeletal protein [Prevotella sp. 10(H)]
MAKIKEVITTANTHNILASGTKITGDVHAEDDFRIDGSIEGSIHCKGKIILGNSGYVNGNIECTNVEIWGELTGNILCFENVILRASSLLNGDIKTKSIEIEPGARFEGKCSMYKEQHID